MPVRKHFSLPATLLAGDGTCGQPSTDNSSCNCWTHIIPDTCLAAPSLSLYMSDSWTDPENIKAQNQTTPHWLQPPVSPTSCLASKASSTLLPHPRHNRAECNNGFRPGDRNILCWVTAHIPILISSGQEFYYFFSFHYPQNSTSYLHSPMGLFTIQSSSKCMIKSEPKDTTDIYRAFSSLNALVDGAFLAWLNPQDKSIRWTAMRRWCYTNTRVNICWLQAVGLWHDWKEAMTDDIKPEQTLSPPLH